MSFKKLVSQRYQTLSSIETLINEYKDRHKGFIYNERRSYLLRKLKIIDNNIESFGKGVIYGWNDTIELEVNNVIIEKNFNVLLTISDITEVTAFIEHSMHEHNCKVKRIQNYKVALGKINS